MQDVKVSAVVSVSGQPDRTFEANDFALKEANFHFNPSLLDSVTRFKALTALFIAECDRLRSEKPDAGREASIAITNAAQAAMWAVKGATKGA